MAHSAAARVRVAVVTSHREAASPSRLRTHSHAEAATRPIEMSMWLPTRAGGSSYLTAMPPMTACTSTPANGTHARAR